MTAKQRLTEAAIPKIAVTDRRQEIPAGGGLYLTIQPSGHKSWALRYRRPGAGMAKVILGPWPTITLKHARRKAHAALGQIDKGNDPAKAKADERAAERLAAVREAEGEVAEAVARFCTAYAKKNRSADQVRAYLERFAIPAWSGKKLSEITASDVKRLVYTFADERPTAANRLLASLKIFFRWAADRDVVPASPAALIRKPSEEQVRERYLDDEEITDLLHVVDAEPFPFGPIVKLLVLTGLRRDEVARAARSEIDLERRTWTIPRERAKADMSLTVHLTDSAVEIINSLPVINGSDYLFPAMRNGSATVSGFSKAKARIDAALDKLRAERGAKPMAKWVLHDLRRTVASGLQRLGFPIEHTEAVLGHFSGTRGGIAGIYNRHSYTAEKRAALEAWGRHLDGLVHPSDRRKVIKLAR